MRRYLEKLKRLLGPLLLGRRQQKRESLEELWEQGQILAEAERDRICRWWPHYTTAQQQYQYLRIMDTFNDDYIWFLLEKAGHDVRERGRCG